MAIVTVKNKQRRDPLATLRPLQADAKRKGLDRLTMGDINAIIAEVRRERRQRILASQPTKKLV